MSRSKPLMRVDPEFERLVKDARKAMDLDMKGVDVTRQLARFGREKGFIENMRGRRAQMGLNLIIALCAMLVAMAAGAIV